MKFHEITSDTLNLISAYADHSVSIGNKVITQNSMVFPESIIENISIQEDRDFQKMCKAIFDYCPEIILIGNSNNQKHNMHEKFNIFYEKNISVETMNLNAACRTFNILISEERKIVLILIF